LRYDELQVSDLSLNPGDEVVLDALCSACMEARMTLSPRSATEFGVKLLCSPDGEEETIVAYNAQKGEFVIDFGHSSTDSPLEYPQNITQQIVPYSCDGKLTLDIFVDRSVIEIFVNSDVVLVQQVYPTRKESRQFKVYTQGGSLAATDIVKWEMDASNPW
jgi:sucrose-6-phosphate hydrolase SacC (GH32 family)